MASKRSLASSIATLKHLPASLLLYSLISIGLAPTVQSQEPGAYAHDESDGPHAFSLDELGPWQTFKTEPAFHAPLLQSAHPEHLPSHLRNLPLSTEHLFFTLNLARGHAPLGPQILDNHGNLVFYSERDVHVDGQPSISRSNPELAYFDPHPCSLNSWDVLSGEEGRKYGNWAENKGDYLCVNDVRSQVAGHAEVIPRIYDSRYQEVKRDKFANAGDLQGPDGHDFHMLPGGKSFLHTVTPKKPYDSAEVQQLWETHLDDSKIEAVRRRISSPEVVEAAGSAKEAIPDLLETTVGTDEAASVLETVVDTDMNEEALDDEDAEQAAPDALDSAKTTAGSETNETADDDALADAITPTTTTDDPSTLSSETENAMEGTTKAPAWIWLYDACFQEIDIQSRGTIFEWCFLDHFDATESSIALDNSATQQKPMDFAHINSVDKNGDGDYLISLKLLNSIIKIAGKNNQEPAGTPLWRLGGLNSTVSIINDDADLLPFTRQAHARFVSTKRFKAGVSDGPQVIKEETISLFDGHCDVTACNSTASGKRIVISHKDHVTNTSAPLTAKLLTCYEHPDGASSHTGGNMQLLANGNVWVSWGSAPSSPASASEFDFETGQLLMHHNLTSSNQTSAYRIVRGTWHGYPTWSPKALAYASDCGVGDAVNKGKATELRVWVSWNGATEVRSWRVWTSGLKASGPWLDAGTFERTGFETEVVLPFAKPKHARLGGTGREDESDKVMTLDDWEDPDDSLSTWWKNRLLHAGAGKAVRMPQYVKLVALDAMGRPLAHGERVRKVWVPYLNNTICDDDGCGRGFVYTDFLNHVGRCETAGKESMPGMSLDRLGRLPLVVFVALIVVIAGIEMLVRFWDGFVWGVMGPGRDAYGDRYVYERVGYEEKGTASEKTKRRGAGKRIY